MKYTPRERIAVASIAVASIAVASIAMAFVDAASPNTLKALSI